MGLHSPCMFWGWRMTCLMMYGRPGKSRIERLSTAGLRWQRRSGIVTRWPVRVGRRALGKWRERWSNWDWALRIGWYALRTFGGWRRRTLLLSGGLVLCSRAWSHARRQGRDRRWSRPRLRNLGRVYLLSGDDGRFFGKDIGYDSQQVL